ncbi:SURF1 family protein [Pseudoxanthomonas sp. UTMC 1351]|uniref:SURF1 family protein n=1 Tax=Pseudoxanthomonas sp. UTMC 1351 TaxID=2695853 RepID=UPI0034CE38B2
MNRRMPMWLGWSLALATIALFCGLGQWQLGRAKQKEAMLAASQKVLTERRPLPLSSAADAARALEYDWTAGEGRFLSGPAVLLDNQIREGRVGVRAYRAFQPAEGVPLLVELGWLPVPGDRRLPEVVLPGGTQALQGLLVPPPSAGISRAAPVRQATGSLLATGLDLESLAAALTLPTLAPRVLKLDPQLPLGYARDLDILPNTLPPERHLGYAVQWFGLALAVLVTAVVLTLRVRMRQDRQ